MLTRKDFMGNHEWCFYGWRKGPPTTSSAPQRARRVVSQEGQPAEHGVAASPRIRRGAGCGAAQPWIRGDTGCCCDGAAGLPWVTKTVVISAATMLSATMTSIAVW